MTGYVRVDTSNNIADGNIISASDLDNEFDGIQAAFNVSTGHNHDGTTGEGAPILVLGPAQDVVVGASTVTPKTTNTVDIGSSSLKFKDLWLSGNTNIAGTTTLGGALTYGGVTLSNAVTGTGNMVLSNSPTLVTPALGTPSSATLTNATGLPIATGVSGLGTGVATALAVNVGSAGAPVVNGGALGTPSSGTVTNLTGTASININGTVGATTANTGSFTTLATSGAVTHNAGTANGVAYLNGSKVLTTGSALTFDGASLGIGTTSPIRRLTVSNSGAEGLEIGPGAANGDTAGAVTSIYYNRSGSAYVNAIQSASNFIYQISGTEGMRLTSTGLGIGTSSPNQKLDVVGSDVGDIAVISGVSRAVRFGANSTHGSIEGVDNTGFTSFQPLMIGGLDLRFTTSGSEQMRLTSTGLGIGTSSPDAKLDVTSVGTASTYTVTAVIQDGNYPASGNPTLEFNGFIGGNGYRSGIGSIGGQQLAFYTPSTFGVAPTRQMTLNESGNLGIGTSSPASQLDVSRSGDATISLTSSGVQRYQLITRSGGNFEVYDQSSAASRLTLTQSGNLGLGVTPSAWMSSYKALELVGGWAALSSNDGFGTAHLTSNCYATSTTAWAYKSASSYRATRYQMGIDGIHAWFNSVPGTAGNAITFTQAMTLDASGNLLVGGTTSPSGKANNFVNLGGSGGFWTKSGGVGYFGTFDNYAMILATNDTERARIDSSGNLLVGTTSTPVSGYNCFSESGADVQLILQRTGGGDGYGGIGAQESYSFVNYGGTGGSLSTKFYVTQGGACYNTTGTYGTISDVKVKENIQDARGYLEDLCQVRIVKYSLKRESKTLPDKLGVIAQELETIFPNMIEEQPDIVNGKEILNTTTKSVKYSVFVPMLIKAIQEQQAIIESLKARLDAANL